MQKIGNAIEDSRIGAKNILVEMTLKEYYDLSKYILSNNEYQRKRVGTSNTVYSLLKEDLRRGCLIPPIVLAYTRTVEDENNLVEEINAHQNEIVILDGLQRSFTIRDLFDDNEDTKCFENNKIRVEFYTGINRIGILYRMLTLNTGQTKMTTRHQIEIIYSDYLTKASLNGIRLIKETDVEVPKNLGEYKYRDVIEGFTSFLERDYLTLERTDILKSIKNLENLVQPEYSLLFEDFIKLYTSFVEKLNDKYPGEIKLEDVKLEGAPFGKSVIPIFSKSQSLTGFGCAMGRLIDFGMDIKCIRDLNSILPRIDDIPEGLTLLIQNLDFVRNHAKKIGNDQRLYFYRFYKALLDKENDSFCSILKAAEEALNQYKRETM